MFALVKFLFSNMKGLRRLVVLAMVLTVLQVSSDILGAFPLKFIPSKVQNAGNDPACLFPFLNPIESWFDIPQIDHDLQPEPNLAPSLPPEAQCPFDANDPNGKIVTVQHSPIGVIVFSLILLVLFGLLSALLAFTVLYLAANIGQQLTARLRNQLFDHLQRLSLDWHGKQQKGDLVQRVTGNISDIEKLVTDGLVDLLAGALTLLGVAAVMLVLSPHERRNRAVAAASYRSQHDLPRFLTAAVEHYRLQAEYDYSLPPHPGTVNYQAWEWPISPAEVCRYLSAGEAGILGKATLASNSLTSNAIQPSSLDLQTSLAAEAQ